MFDRPPSMTPEMEREIYTLVFSLMGLGLLGVILNNVVYISLKDTPNMVASTPHILLGNLSLCNILMSAVVLPFSAIYVSYAHAKSSPTVDIVFCDSFTLVSQTTSAVLPLTLFCLAWHVFLAGRRAERRYGRRANKGNSRSQR